MRYFKSIFWVVLMGLSIVTGAQTMPSAPKPGPIPAPILRAKKVFVANLGTDMTPPRNVGTRGYDAFYAALASWGRYQLVDDPADADLIFEFSVQEERARFELTLVDAKTRIPLWSCLEGFDSTSLRESAVKNFNRHIDHLVGLVKQLSKTPSS
jgi:hypothetical protein